MKTKRCAKCSRRKILVDFYPDKQRKDGLRPYCKKCDCKDTKAWKIRNREQYRKANREYYDLNRELILDRAAAKRREFKIEVFQRLGGICVVCGFSDERALQIDHLHGGGSRDRRQFTDWRAYLKKLLSLDSKALTAQYQLLCANCNTIKKVEHGEYGHGKKSRWKSARDCTCSKGAGIQCRVHS